jgi:outer membrane protein OmpA-like peptidoglycan-associated protein
MYIRVRTGFGDPQPAPSETPLLKKAPPFLVFSRIGPFAVDKSTLTPQLKQQVTRVVDFVRARLNTAQPIGIVRVIGHTDWSGAEPHNVALGNRRSEAVRDELRVQLGDVLKRVLIEVEASPGRSKPIGDNRTAKGQAANRRVDVYVAPPIPPAPPWPKGKTYDWTVRDPDRGGIWDQFRFKRGMPKPLDGKTPRQFLMDLCDGKFSRDTCKTLVDKALSAGCKGVEALLGRLGATITDSQKEEIQRQCSAAADKSL